MLQTRGCRMSRGRALTVCVFFFLGSWAFTQTAFSKGERFFVDNKPKEALPFLEAAAAEEPDNTAAFLYLGIVYLQLEQYDAAIAVYSQILPKGGDEAVAIAYNLGNAYYSKGAYTEADQYYSQAIELDPAYSSAYLNRANTKIGLGYTREAIADYQQYLALAPQSPKRPRIERLIAFIKAEIAADERRRAVVEAQAQAAAEAQASAAEAKAAAAAAQAAAAAAQAAVAAQQALAAQAEIERQTAARQSAGGQAGGPGGQTTPDPAAQTAAGSQAGVQGQTDTASRPAAGRQTEDRGAADAETKTAAAVKAEQARQTAETQRQQQQARQAEAQRQAEIRAEQTRQATAARQAAAVQRREQEGREAETKRQTETARQAAEAERRRKLVEDVASSLQAAAAEFTGLSAGSDTVQTYDNEFELK
jgi:tetratricopeptide (TPR) repeat protein